MKCVLGNVLVFLLIIGAQANVHPEPPPDSQGCILSVHVDGLRNAEGVVGVLLFSSPDGWPEDVAESARHEASPIPDGQAQATVAIEDFAPGDDAVVALHDENRNMKLDRDLFGFTKEGFGFANNPHVGFGPPAFRAAQLPVGCPVTQTSIHILYK